MVGEGEAHVVAVPEVLEVLHARALEVGVEAVAGEGKLVAVLRDVVRGFEMVDGGLQLVLDGVAHPFVALLFELDEHDVGGRGEHGVAAEVARAVGAAQVSPKHAGFVVNNGGATFDEVIALMRHIQKTVYERFGTRLEPEVRIIGSKSWNF